MPRFAMVMLMVVLPGGLLVVTAWLLAQALVEQMRAERGPQSRRLARAVVHLHWRQVVHRAKDLGAPRDR